MKKALFENRWLVVLACAFLIAALLITLFPTLQAKAQAGGTCTSYYARIWDQETQSYITAKKWKCTGYTRPRTRGTTKRLGYSERLGRGW